MKSLGLLICGLVTSVQVFAADITGIYGGDFNGRKGSIAIANDGHNYLLTFLAADGSRDLLGAACNSVIGANTGVKMKKGEVKSLTFEFSAGNCFGIEGREITISVKSSHFTMSIYAHSEAMKNCHFDPNGRQYCDDINWPVYAEGKFIR